MKITALIPVLALLASPALGWDRKAHARIAKAIEKKELDDAMLAMRNRVEADIASRGMSSEKRTVAKRGAGGCRVKGQSLIPSVLLSTQAAAATTTSSSSQVQFNNNVAVVTTSTDAQTTQAQTTQAAATTTSTSASSASTAGTGSNTNNGNSNSGGGTNNGANASNLTPNGKKAGLSAGDALDALAPHIGWWYNWAPTDEGTSNSQVQFVPMLWGNGGADATDAARLLAFETLGGDPNWIIGPEEPDCATGSGSSGMSIAATATLWNTLMAPKGYGGSMLLSPSMCHQAAEDGWLATFETEITRDFDITNLHINKNSMAGVKADLDYYWNKYGKPMWVTEFACVDDNNGFTPCTDQGEINQFISDIVDLFEADSRVYAYAYSNGYGLGNIWPAWSNGALSQSGQAYLSAISKYH